MFSPEDIHMYSDYCIANHRSTVHRVRESGIKSIEMKVQMDGENKRV
jgi:hypothetical protein